MLLLLLSDHEKKITIKFWHDSEAIQSHNIQSDIHPLQPLFLNRTRKICAVSVCFFSFSHCYQKIDSAMELKKPWTLPVVQVLLIHPLHTTLGGLYQLYLLHPHRAGIRHTHARTRTPAVRWYANSTSTPGPKTASPRLSLAASLSLSLCMASAHWHVSVPVRLLLDVC